VSVVYCGSTRTRSAQSGTLRSIPSTGSGKTSDVSFGMQLILAPIDTALSKRPLMAVSGLSILPIFRHLNARFREKRTIDAQGGF
jgi:hypothetical protein